MGQFVLDGHGSLRASCSVDACEDAVVDVHDLGATDDAPVHDREYARCPLDVSQRLQGPSHLSGRARALSQGLQQQKGCIVPDRGHRTHQAALEVPFIRVLKVESTR